MFSCNILSKNNRNLKLDKTTKKVSYTKNDHLKFIIRGKEEGNPDEKIEIYLNDKFLMSQEVGFRKSVLVPLEDTSFGENVVEAVFKTPKTERNVVYKFTVLPENEPKELNFFILESYDHNPKDFTQGLVVEGDTVYESTGGYGTSSLKKYNYKTGKLYNEKELSKDYFGEGVTLFNSNLYQLTYKENKILIYKSNDLTYLDEEDFFSEGWGITNDGNQLIISDGSSLIYFLDPFSFKITRTLKIYDNNGEVKKINELEYIKGELYANIWLKDEIIVIEPMSGEVIKKLNLKNLVKNYKKGILSENVLNGIAYDLDRNLILFTGKRWPVLFAMKIVEEKDKSGTKP